MSRRNLFTSWVRERALWLLLSVSIQLLIWAVPLLWVAAETAYQAVALLVLWLFVIVAVLDFLKFKRHVAQVARLLEGMRVQSQVSDMPAMLSSETERQFWHALQGAYEELARVQQQFNTQHNDLQDYYTLWAHQMKTPIAALSLMVQRLPEEMNKFMFEQEVFKVQQYTDFVLHYLRMETFHRDLVLRRVDVLAVLRDVAKKYAPFFIHQRLYLNLPEETHVIVSDEKWLAVIIEQIFSNAVKYTTEGGVNVTWQGDVLCIQDTGIGIQAADLERVFERGFSGYNGRVSQQSSGLGMYISRQIATQLGIGISIQSTVNQGTCVRLDLSQPELRHKE